MSSELFNKFNDFVTVILALILDSLIVVSAALLMLGVKWVIEMSYDQKIIEIDNEALFYIYKISKYLFISLAFLYAILDLCLMIKKIFKRLRDE